MLKFMEEKKKMKTTKKALLFCVVILPISVLAGVFTYLYQMGLYSEEFIAESVAMVGSEEMLFAITVIQTCVYALICGFFGYILAEKVGLMKSFKFEKSTLIKATLITLVTGVLFSLDYWTFGSVEPLIQTATKDGLTLYGVLASILYGGVIEELLMRLFLMSLLVFLLWKIFYRKNTKEEIPTKIFIIANVIVAVVFAIGHFPATITLFGGLSPLLVFRSLLLNGGFGLVFGWLYRKHGIQYAMLCHAGTHIVCKIILLLFI